MKTKDYVFIAIVFYIGWFGSIYLARTEFSMAAFVFPLMLLGFFLFKKNFALKDLIFVIGISAIGIGFDYLLVRASLIKTSGQPIFLIPIWLISIWLLFSLSMLKIGPKLKFPVWIAAALAGIMGPLSYKSGEYFDVLIFTNDKTFLIYAIYWAITFPLILRLSKRLV